jgi:RNA polymerase sigma-70 factor (ECF subfamily)
MEDRPLSLPPLTRRERASPEGVRPDDHPSFERTFERLFEERFAMLYRYLYRFSGDAALADDVAQEAFVRLYQRGEMPAMPVPWLVSVAHNLVRDEFRRTERRRRLLGAPRDPPPAPPQPDAELLRGERAARVRAVLATLSSRQRQLLLLRHEGRTYEEIAEILQLAPGSVGTLLARATAAFAAAYRRTSDASE